MASDFQTRWVERHQSNVCLRNCRIVGSSDQEQLHDVHISGGTIATVLPGFRAQSQPGNPKPNANTTNDDNVIDCQGLWLMTGLCDAHVHCTADTADLPAKSTTPESLTTARAVGILRGMLLRGFTTIRDCGGADWGLARAIEEGSILGPRLLFTGHALSQTGGHGDMRDKGSDCFACGAALRGIGRVCDGVTEVRRAARDELRKGAHCIKIMASGGVSSPTDRLTNCQFSLEEIIAIVEEATMAKTYVCAHAYMPDAIQRAVQCGVRSIEHGNYLDQPTAALMKHSDAYLVPTLVTYKALRESGEKAGMRADLVAKVGDLVEAGVNSLSIAQHAGVTVCYGSDLLGELHQRQLDGLGIMAQALTPQQVLAAATENCARLFGMENRLAKVRAGYIADVLLVEENPTTHTGLQSLMDPNKMRLIIKEGVVVKQNLS